MRRPTHPQHPSLATVLEALALELRAMRAEAGISQEELALRAEINRTFVGKIEIQKTQPSLMVMLKLSAALGLSLPEFAQRISDRIRTLERVKKHKLLP